MCRSPCDRWMVVCRSPCDRWMVVLQVKQLEQQLLREKAQWMMEADELERKLGAQSGDLDTALAKISDLKQTIK